MVLGGVAGFTSGADLDALFRVLREQAFTREVDDAQDAPRDGSGIDRDWITVQIEAHGTEVRATTRELRSSRAAAFADAEVLLDAVATAGSWTADRGGWIGVHPARRYTPSQPTDDIAGWFGAISAHLVSASD